MRYVDGFVVPVPAHKKEAYCSMATKGTELFKELGTTRIVQCWGDDLPDGKQKPSGPLHLVAAR